MALLTPLFPAAMRAIDALEPVHGISPSKVAQVASLLEESMQAYGRCLLAVDGSPVDCTPTSPSPDIRSRSLHCDNRSAAIREAETHFMWRARLRTSIDAVAVGENASVERAVSQATRELDHLMFTVDKVLASLDVHCVAVTSGVHA